MHETTRPQNGTTIEYRPAMHGHLEVYVTCDGGKVVREAFTFLSLADVLGISVATLEGRYVRARLKFKKVDIRTGSGRPQRGFLMSDLAEVAEIIRTPGAMVKYDPAHGGPAPRQKVDAPLVATLHNGKPHYTIASLAAHYGVSTTTIRNKLERAGLLRRAVNLGTSATQGGRPRRGFPESMLGDVRLAVVEGRVFRTEVDLALMTPGERARALEEELKYVDRDQERSLGTSTGSTGAPRMAAVPATVNRVNSRPQLASVPAPARAPAAPAFDIGDLNAELEALVATAKPVEPIEWARPQAPPVESVEVMAADALRRWVAEDIAAAAAGADRPSAEQVRDMFMAHNAAARDSGLEGMVQAEDAYQAFKDGVNARWESVRAEREEGISAAKAHAARLLEEDKAPTLPEWFAMAQWLHHTNMSSAERSVIVSAAKDKWPTLRRTLDKKPDPTPYMDTPEYKARLAQLQAATAP